MTIMFTFMVLEKIEYGRLSRTTRGIGQRIGTIQ